MKGMGFRKDLWGGDLQFLLKDSIISVQAGVGSDHQAKIRHAIAHPEVMLWLESPSRKFHVWTWGKRQAFNKDGKPRAKPIWTPRVAEIYREGNELKSRPFILS